LVFVDKTFDLCPVHSNMVSLGHSNDTSVITEIRLKNLTHRIKVT